MVLGDYLRQVRNERRLSLRDVQQIAKEKSLGADLSSGYLSLLERSEVKQPSPRILHALAAIYELDYIDLMRRAQYIPDEAQLTGASSALVAFRGASQLNEEQQRRIQHMIDYELNGARQARRRRRGGASSE